MRKFRSGDIVKTDSVYYEMTVIGYQKIEPKRSPLNPYVFDPQQLAPDVYSDTMVVCYWTEGRAEYTRVFHQDTLRLIREAGQ